LPWYWSDNHQVFCALRQLIETNYGDHASIVKFIERNWHLKPLTGRSRDNLKNPIVDPSNPYVPLNAPAVGDLFDMFHFDKDVDHGNDR
jgi:phospholipase C